MSSFKKVEHIIQSCDAHAKWHLQQYQNYCYYARYYARYYHSLQQSGHRQHKKHKNTTHCHQSTAGCGYYFSDKSRINSRKAYKKQRRNREGVPNNQNNKATKDNVELAEQIESDGSEYELDKGFKDFLRQSAEFRKERDAAKQKKKNDLGSQNVNDEIRSECVEYVDILRKGPDGTILPPTASNRKELYEEKYGDAGTKILSLETALQWKFNSVVDTTSPKPWPTLPIRFVKKIR